MKAARNRPLPAALLRLATLGLAAALAAACSRANPQGPTLAPSPEPGGPTSVATAAPIASPTPAASPALDAAAALYREGRFAEAASAYRALAADPVASRELRAAAWFGAGLAADALGEQQAAADAFGRARELAAGESSLGLAAAYRHLRALNDLGRFGEAVDIAVPAGEGPLAVYAAFERGRALAGAGDAPSAAAAWEALLANPAATAALRGAALEALAGLARDAGDGAGLVRWLDARIAFDGSAAARYERALFARDAGDPALAVQLLQAILVATPLAPEATLAIAGLRDLGATVDPGREGFILYRRGAYAEAVRLLTAAVDEPGIPAGERTFRAYYLAASLEELGRAGEAVAWYDAAAATGADSPFVHRAAYWAARVLENEGELPAASERYVWLATAGPPGEFSDEAAFRAGFTLLRADDPAAALAAWEEVGSTPSARLEYWRGRALDLLGRFEEARAAYRAAVEAGPLDFYGFEAAVRLGEADPLTDVSYRPRDLARGVDWDAIAGWLRGRIGGDWTGAAATAACELAAAGLGREATAELLAAANGAGAWRLLELAREAHSCGLTSTALSLAVRLRQATGAASHEVPPDLVRVAYPVAYPAALDAAARARDIDPSSSPRSSAPKASGTRLRGHRRARSASPR